MTRMTRPIRPTLCALVLGVSAGCGAASREARPSSAPSSPSQDSESTMEPARAGAAPPTAATEGAVSSPASAPVSPEPGTSGPPSAKGAAAEESVVAAQSRFDDASKAFVSAGSDCASMCKALGSMSRATDRLCALTDTAPKERSRCVAAKTKLEKAEQKVKSTCGACGGT